MAKAVAAGDAMVTAAGTYSLFQSATTTVNLPSVLAARSALVMVSTPLGTAIGTGGWPRSS